MKNEAPFSVQIVDPLSAMLNYQLSSYRYTFLQSGSLSERCGGSGLVLDSNLFPAAQLIYFGGPLSIWRISFFNYYYFVCLGLKSLVYNISLMDECGILLSVRCEKRFLIKSVIPADSSASREVASSSLLTSDSQLYLYSSVTSRIDLPFPDASMPFNVITIVRSV